MKSNACTNITFGKLRCVLDSVIATEQKSRSVLLGYDEVKSAVTIHGGKSISNN